MKRKIWASGLGAFTVALGVALIGQTSQPPTPSSRTPSSSGKDSVTVTGCLQAGDQSPTGTTGSTAAGAPARSGSDHFILANAKQGAGSSSAGSTASPPSATGTGGSSSSASGTSYSLEGSASELRPHVGHEIEVTGTLDSSSSAGTSATATTPSSSATASAGNMPKLHVSSVKMIASSCGAK